MTDQPPNIPGAVWYSKGETWLDPGWYFWDEAADIHGPFGSVEEAMELHARYMEEAVTNCGNCKWWHEATTPGQGHCHMAPPTPVAVMVEFKNDHRGLDSLYRLDTRMEYHLPITRKGFLCHFHIPKGASKKGDSK